MKILLFGGSGKLGKQIALLAKKNKKIKIYTPTHSQCDITDYKTLRKYVLKINPDIIINSAGLVGLKECEKDKCKAYEVNFKGAYYVGNVCDEFHIRLIYISTAVLFDGKKGMYKETDKIHPVSHYAYTKALGEQSSLLVTNALSIRLDFFPLTGLKYKTIFTDHYTSKIPVNIAGRLILKASLNHNIKGVLNIGQHRDTLFNLLKPYYPDILPIKIKESSMPKFPKDISLDLTNMNRLL